MMFFANLKNQGGDFTGNGTTIVDMRAFHMPRNVKKSHHRN